MSIFQFENDYFVEGLSLLSRLQLKLLENNARREREALLAKLTPAWKKRLESAEYVISEEFFSTFPLSITSAEKSPLLKDKDLKHWDYDDISHARARLEELLEELYPPINLWLGTGPVFLLEEQVSLRELSKLPFDNYFNCLLVEEALGQGAICHEYLGYLPKERMTNNRELIFDIVVFS